MSKPIHPTALFRLTVLGPLASRGEIKHGEVKHIIRKLAAENYNIPGSKVTFRQCCTTPPKAHVLPKSNLAESLFFNGYSLILKNTKYSINW